MAAAEEFENDSKVFNRYVFFFYISFNLILFNDALFQVFLLKFSFSFIMSVVVINFNIFVKFTN